MSELIHKTESYKIIGACFEVYKQKGCGFLEPVYHNIIVEAKAVSTLIDDHRAQTLNYLNASCFDLALLVNFGHYPKIEYERFPHRKFNRTVSDEMQDWVK